MTTINKHRITKHVLQGRTPLPFSVTAMEAAVASAEIMMLAGRWVALAGTEGGLPAHRWDQSGHPAAGDAYAFCGDYDAVARTQHIYMAAACYTVKVPDNAAGQDILTLRARLHGDRWLAQGAIVAAIPSSDPAPPDWDSVLGASFESSVLMAVVPDNEGTDSVNDLTLAFPASTAAPAWLHIVVRLADYAVHRGAWVEGGAMLDAATIEVDYSGTVAGDGERVAIAVRDSSSINQIQGQSLGHVETARQYSNGLTGINRYRAWLAGMAAVGQETPFSDYLRSVNPPLKQPACGLKAESGNASWGIAMAIWQSAGALVRPSVSRVLGVSFANSLVPPAGLELRLAIYGIEGPLTFKSNGFMRNRLAKSSAGNVALWRGDAESITMVDSEDGANVDAASLPMRPLAVLDVTSTLAANTVVPVAWDDPPDFAIVGLALSPWVVTADLGLAAGAERTVTWGCGNITLHAGW